MLLRNNRFKRHSTPKKKNVKRRFQAQQQTDLSLRLESSHEASIADENHDVTLDSFDRVVPKNNRNFYAEFDTAEEKKRTKTIAFKPITDRDYHFSSGKY